MKQQTIARFWAVVFFVGMCLSSLECQGAEVLIYVANETAPEESEAANYDSITSWLRSTADDKLKNIADQLDRDRRMFPAVVDVEVTEISLELPRIPSGPQAMIFTNRLVRKGKCLLWKREWKSPREIPFSVPADDNYIVQANPLSRTETLEKVLAFAAEQFDPHQNDFVLITKSHGSDKKALTPRLVVRAEETSREELLKVASGAGTDQDLPLWAGKLGISKAEYFSILKRADAKHGMKFSLVFMESCRTTSGGIPEIPSNVNRLLLIRENANYTNILWADVLQSLSGGKHLSDVLTTSVPSKFAIIGAGGELKAFPESSSHRRNPLWMYFIPLVLWCGWMAWRWRRRKLP